MKKSNVALQLYSVREEMEKDFFGTMKKVKEMGYSGVEFAGLYGHDPLEVKAMCEELGLVILSAHVPLDAFINDLEGTVDCYKKVGCSYIVIPYLQEEYRTDRETFGKTIEIVKKIGEAVNSAGMVLQYHNHDFEFEKMDDKYILDILYEEVSPELLQTQIDTCWANVGGENPAEYVRKYAGRIPTVHLKDFAGSKSENMYALIGIDEDKKKEVAGDFEFRPLGKGLQNISQIIAASDEGGAQWVIVEQDSPSMGLTELECAQTSVNYLLNEIL